MKNAITLLTAFLISLSSFAQGHGINYKAVIKDDSGNIISNQNLKVKFAVLDLTDTIDYEETHTTTTDANGIITLIIGDGTEDIIGNYFDLDWKTGFYKLKVDIDIAPYDTFVTMGTTAFQAVPYAYTSMDNLWQFNDDNAIALAEKVGIGTDAPTELLQISDDDKASINLTVPQLGDESQIEFRNGLETGAHSFFKVINRSDALRFELDSDLITGTGYNQRMALTNGGLSLQNGTTVNEFSTDGTLAGNSDSAIPTERAVKAYVDNASSSITKTLILPATTFTGNQSSTNFINYRNFGAYAQITSGNGSLVAPLTLPVGATVTSITFYLRDDTNLGGVNLEVGLLRSFQSAAVPSIVFNLTTFATSFEENYNTPFTMADDYQYFFRVRPTTNWDSNLGIHSVKVTYTE